jgi:predicted short-subunit dehydrogenase-like oxidoreductase (DUF2520 family)
VESVVRRDPVAVVGAGAVGTALAHALQHAGVRIVAVASRSTQRAESLAYSLGRAQHVSIEDAGSAAPIVLVAVSDNAIDDVSRMMRVGPDTLVAHTSGSRSVDALDPARVRGASVGGFHPLAAVVRARSSLDATPEAYASVFRGAAFAIEGNDSVYERLAPLALELGGHPFRIAARSKALYHLGASMLAAFSAGLAQAAWKQMREAGASDDVASSGVSHLMRTVANNVGNAVTPAHALTGPVARGDAAGVRRQADAAKNLSAEAEALYRAHVRLNIVLARDAGRISGEVAQVLMTEVLPEDKE